MIRVSEAKDGIYCAYEMIEGKNLYDALRSNDIKDPLRVYKVVVDQSIELGNAVPANLYDQLNLHGTKFSLQNPLARDVLLPHQEIEFDQDYKKVLSVLQRNSNLFPGIYSDRNPGNILLSSDNKIFQVDFGVIEATSPLFDLTKLLRTHTGEPSTQNLAEESPNNLQARKNSLVNMGEEEVIYYAFDKLKNNSRHAISGNFNLFKKGYLFAAFNEHIFYLTKAISLLSTKKENISVQTLRKNYHQTMLSLTFEQLINIGEPIDTLHKHINSLIELSDQ